MTSKYIKGNSKGVRESFKNKEVIGLGNLDPSDVNKVLDNSNKYFLTFPLGLNKLLDETILFSQIVLVMKKIPVKYDMGQIGRNSWQEDESKAINVAYGLKQGSANSIVILTNLSHLENTSTTYFEIEKLEVQKINTSKNPQPSKKKRGCCN